MEIINRLFEISIYSAVLYLAILVIKKTCKNKMSPALHFIIWFLLIARLCVPVTIDSGLQLIVIPNPASAEAEQEASASGQGAPITISPEAQNSSNFKTVLRPEQAPQTAGAARNELRSLFRYIASIKWADIFLAVWLMGILLRTVWMMVSAIKVNRIILTFSLKPTSIINNLLGQCKKELGVKKDIPLYLLPNMTTPALTIGLRPKMLLPLDISQTLNEEQLKFAIRHELMHYKRKDNIICLLLRILEAVYWFNPVVWLMSKNVVADMETACDNRVVQAFDNQGREHYVSALLLMFSQKNAPKFMLGMALNHVRKIAEKRIRGVYMCHRSHCSVKIMAGILAALLFVACFTTACQQTPKEAVVIGKGDGQLEEKILNQGASQQPSDLPQSGERIQRSLSNESGKMEVTVDAEVVRSDDMVFPAVEVKPAKFTQEQADKIMAALVGDDYFYDSNDNGDMTKDQWDEQIVFYQQKLSETDDESEKEALRETISRFVELREHAPATPEERPEASRKFSKEQAGGEQWSEGISGKVDRSGRTYVLFIKNSDNGKQSYAELDMGYGPPHKIDRMDSGKQSQTVGISYEDAYDQAQKLLQHLGAGLSLADAFLVRFGEYELDEDVFYGYQFVFTREISGLNVVYETTDVVGYSGSEEDREKNNAQYQEPWPYEQLSVTLNEQGIQQFLWKGPCAVEHTLSEDVRIQPFDETMKRFEQMFIIQNAEWESWVEGGETGKIAVTVNRITLGLSRVQSGSRFYLIPVWDFYGSMEQVMKDGTSSASKFYFLNEEDKTAASLDTSLKSLLTINAIDGSVVDRLVGY